jgi:hypothetical protein
VIFAAALCASCGSSAETTAPGDQAAVCPPSVEPTFASIRQAVFEASCETAGACHSTEGAVNSGQLDLQTDPYEALLGDGTGVPANNISGSDKGLVRVAPGDPENSFLVIKLRTMVPDDPKYGSGMPFGNPGSVCDKTRTAVSDWIRAGAKP